MATVGLSASRPLNQTPIVRQPGSPMRLYFDLKGSDSSIPDVYGIEVSDLEEARRAALEMIHQLRQEDPSAAQDWSGWTLSAVDFTGSVVFAIDLDRVA